MHTTLYRGAPIRVLARNSLGTISAIFLIHTHFTIHGLDSRHNPGYSILLVDAVAIIRIRAKRCHGVVSVPNGSCVL
jgi:hypothetical protein